MTQEAVLRRPTLRERLQRREHGLSDHNFSAMMAEMIRQGEILRDTNPADDATLSGAGDTGSIVKQTDISISIALLNLARRSHPGSFSEEHDSHDRGIIFPLREKYVRLRKKSIRDGVWEIDPVDGTGDRDKGEPGSPERMGYSILANFVRNGEVDSSVVVRPAYNQVLTYRNGTIQLTENEVAREITTATREENRLVWEQPDQQNVVRVNVRKAYPEVKFPPDFWEFAHKLTGIRFQEVRCGGAGDALSKLVLGELDLVVARKGDWKTWDTGPFDPMIKKLGGRLTDCDTNPLEGHNRVDLWHHRGVVASIGKKGLEAHDGLVIAMKEYKKRLGIDLVIQTSPKV